ncbi:MAG: DoxX family protein [Armatimonadota bacterium]
MVVGALDVGSALEWAQWFVLGFFAVLFLQSGLDKVFDWKGNFQYHKEHFASSPLAPLVPVLLPILTVMEVGTGALSAVAAVQFLLGDARDTALAALAAAGITLLSLFAGQRMARDYAGAAGLVPYFLVALFGLLLHADVR